MGQDCESVEVAAILAGYTWDQGNPLVKNTARRLAALEAVCMF
jgi:hypothetical protein